MWEAKPQVPTLKNGGGLMWEEPPSHPDIDALLEEVQNPQDSAEVSNSALCEEAHLALLKIINLRQSETFQWYQKEHKVEEARLLDKLRSAKSGPKSRKHAMSGKLGSGLEDSWKA